MAATAAIIGGAALAGGALAAGSQEAGPSGSDIAKSLKFRPVTGGALFQQLTFETLLSLGAPIEQIELEMLFIQAGEALSGRNARNIRKQLESANARLVAGDDAGAQKIIDGVNQKLRKVTTGTRGKAASAQLEVRDGTVRANFSGQLGEQFQQAEQLATQIRDARFENNLRFAEGPFGLEEDARAFLMADLESDRGRLTADAIEQANRLGFSPGAQLSDIDRQFLTEQTKINTGGALDRAMRLFSGAGAALQPPLLDSTLTARGQNLSSGAAANQNAMQLAIAQAEAENAAINRLSSGLGSAAGASFQLSGVGGFGTLSADDLAGALGKQQRTQAGVDLGLILGQQ